MKMNKQLQNEKGMALLVILAVVVLMSLIGTTILFSSNNGRKISTSYRSSADALQNAEAGIAEASRKLFNKEIVGGKLPDGKPDPGWKYDEGFTPNIANEYTVSYVLRKDNAGVNSVALDEAGFPLYQIVSKGYVTTTFSDGKPNINYAATSSGTAGVEKKLLAMVQVINTPGTSTRTERDPAFGGGIVSNGDLRINGSSNINGGTHSNGNTVFHGSGTVTGTVSAHGSLSPGNYSITGAQTQNAKEIVLPSVADKMAALEATARASGIYKKSNFNYNGSGDLGNKVIFVDGDLTLNGDIMNGTIVATGNVTINGSSQINTNQAIGTAIVALGDIIMNGASDSYGAFWSNGSFVQNGSSRVFGTIVSQGDITRNGSFNFTASDKIQNDNLPTVTIPGSPAISKYKVLSRKEV